MRLLFNLKQLSLLLLTSGFAISHSLGSFPDVGHDRAIAQSVRILVPSIEESATPERIAAAIDRLKSSNPIDRLNAVRELVFYEKYATAALPHLIPLLKDTNPDIRAEAAITVGLIGESTAVPHLMPLLKDPSNPVRSSAARAVGKMGDASQAALLLLIAMLQEHDPQVRSSAIAGLGWMGQSAQVALPQIRLLLKDSDQQVVFSAAETLVRLGDHQRGLTRLIALLKAPDTNTRSRANLVLKEIKDPLIPAIPQLIPLLQDSDWFVRSTAAEVLETLGQPAKVAIPFLIPLLNDPNGWVRNPAVRTLSKVEEPAKFVTSFPF